jgi:leucyl/phenylalanyl-tRNA--protein transferase
MPVFELTRRKVFPPPELADDDGLLAVGGDLAVDRLLLAYSMGIFPWYSEDSPILWWSPDPRLVLFPGEFRLSRSLRQTIRKGTYTVTFDTAFSDVIAKCAGVRRRGERGTWITDEMSEA